MKKLSLFLLLLIAIAFNAKAAFLLNVPQIIIQPNGDTIHCFASGDEFYNYLHDENGFTIVKGDDGYYYYATEIKGKLTSSRHKVGRVNPENKGLKPRLKINREDYLTRRNTLRSKSAEPARAPNPKGVIDGITIYIRFNGDPEFTRSAMTQIHNNFNASNNSVRDYFQKVSYNQLDIRTTHIPANTGTAITSFVATNSRNYYRPHHATTNPTGYKDDNERARREWQLLRDAINWVRNNNLLPSGLVLDSDGDGYVDLINFVVQGSSEGWNDILWAHQWSLQTVGNTNFVTNITDRVRVRAYTFLPEDQTSVRTLSHEVYHVLGAPDLYHYDDAFNHISPVGRWDLMETGSGHMLTHMKMRYGNWISSNTPEITKAGTYTLFPQGKNSTSNVYKIPGNAQEYFLLEYRQLTDDNYEMNTPGSGLIATRINPSMSGNAQYNGTTRFNEVYVLRPGGAVNESGLVNNANLSDRVERTALSKNHATVPFFSNGTVADFLIYDIVNFGDSLQFSFLPKVAYEPKAISGKWREDSIFLYWTPSISQKNVVLICDTLPISDFLENDRIYSVGDQLFSGATVLYMGSDSSFVHRPIDLGKTYYYRLFTNDSRIYSRGINTNVRTHIDTLRTETLQNFSLPADTLGAYTFTSNNGFLTGHNTFGNWRFAELFRNTATGRVQKFAFNIWNIQNTSKNGHIHVSVWDRNNLGMPNNELTKDSIPYSQLQKGWNEVVFKNPAMVDSDFFVGISISYKEPIDTIVLYSTTINPARPVTGFFTTRSSNWNTFANAYSANIGMAYMVEMNFGGMFLTSLPQRLNVPIQGVSNLVIDIFSTHSDYEVVSDDDWIYLSVDRVSDRIFVDVEPSEIDRTSEILIISETDTARVFVYQSSTVSIQKDEELMIVLFPNPSADGIFYLQSDGGEMQLDVFDMMGRNILSRKTYSNSEKIDLSRHTNGMYLLRIIKNGQQKTFRLVKP